MVQALMSYVCEGGTGGSRCSKSDLTTDSIACALGYRTLSSTRSIHSAVALPSVVVLVSRNLRNLVSKS